MDQQLRKRRSFVAPLVTLLCAVVLAGGSCYGFLSTFNINGSGKHAALNVFFIIVFFSNVVAVPWAIVFVIFAGARHPKTRRGGGGVKAAPAHLRRALPRAVFPSPPAFFFFSA